MRDQASCGACTAFDVIGAFECNYHLKYGEFIDLSEQDLFMCSGGHCYTGNYMPPVLNRALRGIPLESCVPYRGFDTLCGMRDCSEWWLGGKRLASWRLLNGISDMRDAIQEGALAGTMAVYQSFLNYKSGVYHKLANDQLAGYHGITIVGVDDELGAWKLKNSWGEGWGMDGYCWLQFGDSEIEDESYAIMIDGAVEPDPPTPSPCNIGKGWARAQNVIPWALRRKGRLFYLDPPS